MATIVKIIAIVISPIIIREGEKARARERERGKKEKEYQTISKNLFLHKHIDRCMS